MKKYIVIILIMAGYAANAQYKKASFFNKSGRTYDIGLSARLQSGERKPSPGFFLSFGKMNGDKHIGHWYDLELMAGNKYEYTTTSSNFGAPSTIKVSGQGGIDYNVRYNLAYFFKLADEEEETSLYPFINLTLGYSGGTQNKSYTVTPSGYDPDKVPAGIDRNAFIFGGGVGVVYMLTDVIGLKLSGAYYGIMNSESSYYASFFPVVNHPAVHLAIRFRMSRE